MIYTILFLFIVYMMIGYFIYRAMYALACSEFIKTAEHLDGDETSIQDDMDKLGTGGVVICSIVWPGIIALFLIVFAYAILLKTLS